jgi:hypothetical protein
MSPTSRLVALSAIFALVVCGCRNKEDDEDPREHRKQRVNAGATGTSSGGGVSFGCPFGLCGGGLGGSDDPEHVCKRMVEIMSKGGGGMKIPTPSEKDLEQCVKQMETMRTSQPKEYAMMAKCADTAADASALVQCMTQMYLDGGVP